MVAIWLRAKLALQSLPQQSAVALAEPDRLAAGDIDRRRVQTKRKLQTNQVTCGDVCRDADKPQRCRTGYRKEGDLLWRALLRSGC